MAQSNYERIGKGLELLRDGLGPFVQRELEGVYKGNWQEEAQKSLRRDQEWRPQTGEQNLDVQAQLLLITNLWHEVFKKTLGQAERNLVFELRTVRNRWAHQEAFSTDDTLRALDSMARLLEAASAPSQPLRDMHRELLRQVFDQEARQVTRRAAQEATKGEPTGALPPWRDVIAPHPDVAQGTYLNAEFAADLVQVHEGTATEEYGDPQEFFRRTFLTEGLRYLLAAALERLTSQGGDPVVELQTNFGGGKTHSMLALYHLFSGTPATSLLGVEELLQETGVDAPPKAHRAVLVGTNLSPGQSQLKTDGTRVHTLWGELAWQLGGKEGYAMVAEADQSGMSPGSQVLRELFAAYSPALILIDEWVRYVAPTYNRTDLPGGSFDAQITFAQSLTEAATQSPRTLLVASIPSSDIEMGGEGGVVALERLKHVFGRVESPWRPATPEEGFEIVRRRLFLPLAGPESYKLRDAVCDAFARHYRESPEDFPREAVQPGYRDRLQRAYPIHPDLFDRLYGSWSAIDKFQRTRGVLRLMATVIHALWEQGDKSLLILPSFVPIGDAFVQRELTRYLPDNWTPVIERDVDGPASLPLRLDGENKAFGRYSAARRVTRTIYLGTAPLTQAANRGIDEREVKLGCVQPGESGPVFGDALRRLVDQATYLYPGEGRYWFSPQPSVNRLAQDRAAQIETYLVEQELKERLQRDKARGIFKAVHVFPEAPDRVPDEEEARLVVLRPMATHSAHDQESPALQAAQDILEHVGSGARYRRNQLIFLAAEHARWAELEPAVQTYLAWKYIADHQDALNLDTTQRHQAAAQFKSSSETVDLRIKETFCWLLSPSQKDVTQDISWQEQRLGGDEEVIFRASRKAKSMEWLYDHMGGAILRLTLDEHIWSDRPHVGLQDLWGYCTNYLYMPRLQSSDVLLGAVRDGLSQLFKDETFAYADRFDESQGRYVGLRLDRPESVQLTRSAVLVKPDVAYAQLGREQVKPPESDRAESGEGTERQKPSGDGTGPEPPKPPVRAHPKRFHAATRVDAMRLLRDVGQIQDEIVQHLTALVGAEVEVTVEIHARIPDGVPEATERSVSENCRTLRFQHAAFEDE